MSEEMDIEALLRKVHSEGLPRYPLLVVFFTGSDEPPDCVSMLRAPMPRGGFVFGEDFGSQVRQAVLDNESATMERLRSADRGSSAPISALAGLTVLSRQALPMPQRQTEAPLTTAQFRCR